MPLPLASPTGVFEDRGRLVHGYGLSAKDGAIGEATTSALRSKLPTARVILTRHGTTPRRTHVLTALKYLETKLGVRAWSFRALRHFFISELVRRRVSVEVVRLLAGHSALNVTQRYVHAEASELRAGISVLSG